MKRRLFLIAMLVSIVFIINAQSANALQLSSQSWSSNKYFQGDNGGTVTITLYNNVALFQWYIQTVQIQFDWQVQSNYVYSTPVGQNIASGQSGTYTIQFDVPQSASVGTHSYTISYMGIANDVHPIITSSFIVHNMYEKQYDDLLSSVQAQLNSAGNYNSPDARSDISQAQSYFVQATTLASQNQYQSAVDKLNAAQNMINQASTAEQSYNSIQSNQGGGYTNNNYYSNSGNSYSSINPALIGIVAFLAAVVGGGVAFWIIRKKNKNKSQSSNNIEKPAPIVEEKRHDAMHVTSGDEDKVENMKNENVSETMPKIEIKQASIEKEKTLKSKKTKKTKEEIEQDKKALGILKERLATGTITKSEYSELKKEFE